MYSLHVLFSFLTYAPPTLSLSYINYSQSHRYDLVHLSSVSKGSASASISTRVNLTVGAGAGASAGVGNAAAERGVEQREAMLGQWSWAQRLHAMTPSTRQRSTTLAVRRTWADAATLSPSCLYPFQK